MRLWKIKKEKHADRISEKFGIKQEHKKQKLKLEEMSSKSVNEIYKKWKQERKEASTEKGTGNLKLRLRSKDEATSKLPSTTKKSSSFELPRTRSLGSSV
jgi:predicted Zn-dependent protease